MVKLPISPSHGIVAALASGRERELRVVYRSERGVVILQVTRGAGRGGDVVIVVDVAVRANPRRIGVRIRQRKAHGCVIERRWLPRDGGMALLAGLRKTSRDVIRIGSGLKILQVAGRAGRGGQVVVVVDMAVRANPRRIGVRIRQREASA